MSMCCWKGSLSYRSTAELNIKCRTLNLEWGRNHVDEAVPCAPAEGCLEGAVWLGHEGDRSKGNLEGK